MYVWPLPQPVMLGRAQVVRLSGPASTSLSSRELRPSVLWLPTLLLTLPGELIPRNGMVVVWSFTDLPCFSISIQSLASMPSSSLRIPCQRPACLVFGKDSICMCGFATKLRQMGEDEVAQLQADFNAMATNLERTMHELQEERDRVAGLLQARRELIANVS